jgi:hypothetical protein
MALYGFKSVLKGLLGANAEDAAVYMTRVTFGSSTAVASQIGNDMVVSKVDTGKLKLQFTGGWGKVLGFSFGFKDASGAALSAVVLDESYLASDGYLLVEIRDGSGAAHPVSGDVLFLQVVLTDNLNNRSR